MIQASSWAYPLLSLSIEHTAIGAPVGRAISAS